jgi:hypothetical protein
MSSETEFVYRGEKPADGRMAPQAEGANWVLFAGIMVVLVGVLNVIYGIAAISKSSFFNNDAKYILSDLRTWGWVGVCLGALQISAAYSIWRGGQFGRWFGIAMASLGLIGALLSLPAYPFWSLTLVALDILVLYGLAAYGGQHQRV